MFFPYRKASLMTMLVSSFSQSDMGDIKPENWSNSFIKPSSSVALSFRSWAAGSFLPVIILSITLFTNGSVEIEF